MRIAACTNPLTVARTGKNRNTSIPIPASTMLPSILRIPRSSMRRPFSGVEPGGAITAEVPAARSGRLPTEATLGPGSTAQAGPSRRMESTDASPSRFFAPIRKSCTPRWKPEPAEAPAEAQQPRAVPLHEVVAEAAVEVKRQRAKLPRRETQQVAAEEDVDAAMLLPIRTAAACSAPKTAAQPGPT